MRGAKYWIVEALYTTVEKQVVVALYCRLELVNITVYNSRCERRDSRKHAITFRDVTKT